MYGCGGGTPTTLVWVVKKQAFTNDCISPHQILRLAQKMIQGKGKTLGLPDLRSGRKVRIKGLGRFSGLYAVNTTTHTIGDSGYTTDFTATMEMALSDDQPLPSDPS